MNSSSPAARAAAITSSRVAPGRPRAMFSRIVPLKMNGSWDDQADPAAQRRQLEVAQVHAVDQDAALGGSVEAHQELQQRRLARAALADDRHGLAGRDARGSAPPARCARQP